MTNTDALGEKMKVFVDEEPLRAIKMQVTLPAWAWWEIRQKLFTSTWSDEANVNAASFRLDDELKKFMFVSPSMLEPNSAFSIAQQVAEELNSGLRHGFTVEVMQEIRGVIKDTVESVLKRRGFDFAAVEADELVEQATKLVVWKQEEYEIDARRL